MTNDVGFCWELLVNLSFEGPLFFLHYIVATSYVHWIQLKVYKLAQRVLSWWLWPLFDIMKVWISNWVMSKWKPCHVLWVVGLVLGSSQQLVNQVCSYVPIYTHTRSYLRCWLLYRKSSFQKSMCMQWFFCLGQKITSIDNFFLKKRKKYFFFWLLWWSSFLNFLKKE